MKSLRKILIAALLAFTGLYCNQDAAIDVLKSGGPAESPVDLSFLASATAPTASEINALVSTVADIAATEVAEQIAGSESSTSAGTGTSADTANDLSDTATVSSTGGSSDSSSTGTGSASGTDTTSTGSGTDNSTASNSGNSGNSNAGGNSANSNAGGNGNSGNSNAGGNGNSDNSNAGGNSSNSNAGGNNAAAADISFTIDTTAGKWFTNPEGIYTAWSNQVLRITISNIKEAGWYTIAVSAKNIYGPLPDFYKYFTISAYNENSSKSIGGISIKASDNTLNKGSMRVYLEPNSSGQAIVVLKWINDAYKQGEYDANILIGKVAVWKSKNQKPKKNLSRNAFQYSQVDGRFFWDEKSVYTYWENQTISFFFPNLESGKYEIEITAKNNGIVPPKYKEFEVLVDADGVSGTAKINADADKYNKGGVVLDLTGGDTSVSLTWLNDMYKEGVYDANIQIKKLKLKKIGDSKRSKFAAYLLGTKSGNRVMLGGIFGVLLISIAGISVWNRKKAKLNA